MGIWTEKYRPQEFNEVIGIDKSISKMITQDMPNFLFVGPAGTGKTTTARIIINILKADSLILNSSLDRKIEIVRERVREFSKSMSYDGKIKIVFMDEADGILPATQEALRNIIETYSQYVRFIFTANNESKITDAIKSRCALIRFVMPDKNKIFLLLSKICFVENIEADSMSINLLIDKFYPDIRRMINAMQEITKNGTESLILEKIKSYKTTSNKILELVKKKDLMSARETIHESGEEADLLFKEIYMSIMENDSYDFALKQQVNDLAKQSNFYMSGALFKEIALDGFLFGLMKVKL